MVDANPRPSKRARVDCSPPPMFSSQSTLTPPPSSEPSSPRTALKPLPPHILLVSLPSLLALPPNHRNYIQSLVLSLCALRKCLSLPALSPEVECRTWCGIAEIGMKVISGGFTEDGGHTWARDIEAEVDKALSKAIMIAQKHPSLRSLRIHLSLLQAQLSQWQHKTKFARNQIRSLISSFKPTDPPSAIYSAHLAAISLYSSPKSPHAVPDLPVPNMRPLSSPYIKGKQDVHAALSTLQDMEALSLKHGHAHITLLAHVLRLRILVAADMWQEMASAIPRAESVLGLSYDPATTPKPRRPANHPQQSDSSGARGQEKEATFIFFEDAFEAAMAIHTLMMTVVYLTHMGSAAEAAPRLSHLHALLDSDALEKFPDGTVEAKFHSGPPLSIQVTHPRILFLLGFLISSVAKRDPVGRKPKRKVFAIEGVSAWDRNLEQELLLPMWASMGDVEEIEQRLARIKGDLLCELVAVSIMRSEFDAAEQTLDSLIAHVRTYSIFPNFSARIALHHAHLAHALNHTTRSLTCYRVAAQLAGHDEFVRLSARVGEVVLLLGLQSGKGNDADAEPNADDVVDTKEAMNLAKACHGMGGTLEAVGQIVEALISPEILRAKEHLKHSLALATKAQDNYLRAVVLALVAAHYFHTAGDHAYKMLQTCEQLAAGLGAPAFKNASVDAPASVGNACLGLWVGQKFLELYKRANREDKAQKQIVVNERFEAAVKQLAVRNGIKEEGCSA